MMKGKRIFTSIIIGMFVLGLPAVSQAQSDPDMQYKQLLQQQVQPPTTLTMAADLLVARPLLIGATAVGTVFFVVSLPFTLVGNNVADSADKLIGTPGKAAFFRCLGCRT